MKLTICILVLTIFSAMCLSGSIWDLVVLVEEEERFEFIEVEIVEIQDTKEMYEAAYQWGKREMTNLTIKYANGMQRYIAQKYNENYPNETALCITADITNESILIYGYSNISIWHQDDHSVGFDCPEMNEKTIRMHSHPSIEETVFGLCYPSDPDLFAETSLGLIVCGNKGDEIVDTISFYSVR